MRLLKLLCLLLLLAIGYPAQETPRGYSVFGSKPTAEQAARSAEYHALLAKGWNLTPAEAAELETKLRATPEDLTARLTLMSYYSQHLLNDQLLEHVIWQVSTHPDADYIGNGTSSFMGMMHYNGTPDAKVQTVNALWKQQAARFPNQPRVLANASIALLSSDPGLALELAKAARRADPANPLWTNWLARTYAHSLRLTFCDGAAMVTFLQGPEESSLPALWLPDALGPNLRKELEASTDVPLLAAVGAAITRQTEALAAQEAARPGGNLLTPDVPKFAGYGRQLSERARTLQAKSLPMQQR